MADITLQKPTAGQVVTLVPQSEDRLLFDFDAGSATLTRDDNNLVMSFEDGASLVLTDFYVAYTSENMPTFLIEGAEVKGEDFFAALGDELMPAAGPAAGPVLGSGSSVGFGFGVLGEGLTSLGTINSDLPASSDGGLGISGINDAAPLAVAAVAPGPVGDLGIAPDVNFPAFNPTYGFDATDYAVNEDYNTSLGSLATSFTPVEESKGAYIHLESGLIFSSYAVKGDEFGNLSAAQLGMDFEDVFTKSSVDLVINEPIDDVAGYEQGLGIGYQGSAIGSGEVAQSTNGTSEVLVVEMPEGKLSYNVDFQLACRSLNREDDSNYADHVVVLLYHNGELVGSKLINGVTADNSETFSLSSDVGFDTVAFLPVDGENSNPLVGSPGFTLSSIIFSGAPAEFAGEVELLGASNASLTLLTIAGQDFDVLADANTGNTLTINGQELSLVEAHGIYSVQDSFGEVYFSLSLDATGQWDLHQFKTLDADVSFVLQATNANGAAQSHTVVVGALMQNMEEGTPASDVLIGSDARDALYGGAGDDTLQGQDGNDLLHGEDGDDMLFGGLGDDILYGGFGSDLLDGGAGDDIFFAGVGDEVLGGAGDDIIYLDDLDLGDVFELDGGAGMDVLLAGVNTSAELQNVFSNGGSSLSSMEVIMLGDDADAARVLQQSISTDAAGNLDESSLITQGWTAKADATVGGVDYTEFTKMDAGQETIILVQKQMDMLG